MRKSFGFGLACALLAIATPPLAATTKAPPMPFPVATFAQFPAISGAKLNANGSLVAAKFRSGGEKVLGLIDLSRPGSAPMLIARDGEFMGYGDRRVLDWEWFDAENLLIRIAEYTDIEGQKIDVTRLINFNARTRKRTLVGWDNSFLSADNVLWRSREGRPRILLSRWRSGAGTERIFQPEVIEVDLETGQQRVVETRRRAISGWVADGQGVVRMGFGGDRESGKRTVLYRPDATQQFKTIVNEKAEKYGSGSAVPQIFLADGRTAITTSRRDGFTEVYEMDLATMALGKKLMSVPGYDVDGVHANAADDRLDAISWTAQRSERKYLEPRLAEIQAMLDETFGRRNARIASTDRARETILVSVGAPDQRGSYYIYHTVSGKMALLSHANAAMTDMHLNPVSTIKYSARDGKQIEAVLTLPRLRTAKSLPLIVMPHGGPWARDAEDFDRWAQPLAELGYAVIQPNFRGSAGYGKAWEAAADGAWGNAMQDDLLDAITALGARGIADPKRVCIMGWSYGGYAASRAAQRDGKHYRCAISGAGVHDLPDMVGYDRQYLGEFGSKYIGAAGRLPDISPARHADQFSVPILIVHGKVDKRVPVSQSRNLVKALKSAGKVEGRDFVYLEQPKNTHHFPFEADEVQFLEAVRDFLAKHNPA